MEKENQEKQVPDLKMDEQKRIVIQKKEIPLMINGKEGKVTIKKLSTSVRNKIRSDCTQTKIIGGQANVNVNDSEVQEKILFACIVSAPFELTLQTIKDLPADVSDYLLVEYQAFAEPTDSKKE